MLPPVVTWVYLLTSQPVEKLPALVSSPGGLHLTGEISLGQIGVVIAIVWAAARVFFPLLARIDNVEKAFKGVSKDVHTMKDVQIAQGAMIQRMIGQLEGEALLRLGPPSPILGGRRIDDPDP